MLLTNILVSRIIDITTERVNMETTKRSLIKTLSWEFVHLVIIAGVIFVITGEWEYATLGALVYIAWEALAYFIHERIWAKFVKIK
jgi:uncharacterized membrane protein